MKVYLVKVAVLLAVMSFIFCTEDFDPSAASEESGSTEFPKQPVFCSVSLDDQGKIFNCTQHKINEQNSQFAKKLTNYTWLFCENITNFVTIVCNKTNEVLVDMTRQEDETLLDLIVKCED
uniref:Putative salivary secreted peptide n=1 Tax=Ixodes pacificus TaxID=29930 RepID=Q6B8C9_IXOPA|nr:putative salivary secreted peptide [Ixodes pacificus]